MLGFHGRDQSLDLVKTRSGMEGGKARREGLANDVTGGGRSDQLVGGGGGGVGPTHQRVRLSGRPYRHRIHIRRRRLRREIGTRLIVNHFLAHSSSSVPNSRVAIGSRSTNERVTVMACFRGDHCQVLQRRVGPKWSPSKMRYVDRDRRTGRKVGSGSGTSFTANDEPAAVSLPAQPNK